VCIATTLRAGSSWGGRCVALTASAEGVQALPTTFAITAFHNDIYRSMGGFARVHRVLKRPKNLESRLFFEFKWGYFFYVHREDECAPPPSLRLSPLITYQHPVGSKTSRWLGRTAG
jgi:hypothetical protein